METDDRNEKRDRERKYKKPKKNKIFKIIVIILLLIIIGFGTWKIADKYMPNFEQISIREAFPEWNNDGTVIILRDTPIKTDNSAINKDEEVYIPVEFAKQYIDKYIFWEDSSQKLTITTQDKVIRMKTDDLTAYVNNKTLSLDVPIQNIDGTAYMPSTLLESLYDVSIKYIPETDIVIVDYTDQVRNVATITNKKISVREQGNIKSRIVTKLVAGEEVTVYDTVDKWTKIRTNTGISGYIPSKYIENINEILPKEKKPEAQVKTWKPDSGKINMVWDQVTNIKSSSNISRLETKKGLDVMSPTWFSIADETGLIKNIADKQYVNWAHNQGYQVWALLDNQFNGSLTHKVLSNTDTREYIIKQLLVLAELYDLDGINIDFESIKVEDGDYYLQFIRELTPFLKEQGLIVSVDVYVPAEWTQHYQRDEVAKIVDYIAIMAYDEHWSTSKESGSVASIGWVEKGMKNSLEQIPKEKLIMGMPYFTRLWTETTSENGVEVKSQAYGMEKGRQILEENNAEIVWDEETKQYYGEYKKNNLTYKMWLEDERSIQEKLEIVKKYDLAGVAGWKLKLENDKIWDVIYKNLKQ